MNVGSLDSGPVAVSEELDEVLIFEVLQGLFEFHFGDVFLDGVVIFGGEEFVELWGGKGWELLF